MSTPELEQALRAAKWKGAEGTLSEVIAKTLDVPTDTVRRVVYAWDQLRDRSFPQMDDREVDCLFDGLAYGDHIEDDVKEALRVALDWGVRRAFVRQAMTHNRNLEVKTQQLLPKDKVRRMCDGCPTQLACVTNMLSTPEQCWKGHFFDVMDAESKRHRTVQYNVITVKPLKLVGNTVTVQAEHPRGVYQVNVTDINL